MNARAFTLLCVAAVCLLVSLAPAGAAPPEKKRCPFAGTYAGTYTAMSPAGDQEGEVTMTVDEDGIVTGESKGATANEKATIKGQILKDNKSSIVFESTTIRASAFGTFSKTSSGGLTGTMTQRVGTTAVASIEFEMKPKAK